MHFPQIGPAPISPVVPTDRKDQVQRWATKKSLIRMLCTLEKIMPRDRVPLPKLDLRPNSTAADVKKAYKHALRAVHPDKLATASVDDRVRADFVFSALRESYERFSLTVDDYTSVV